MYIYIYIYIIVLSAVVVISAFRVKLHMVPLKHEIGTHRILSSRSQGYKTFFVLNSTEHKICHAIGQCQLLIVGIISR